MCQSCGTDPEVWAEDPFAYHPIHVTCPGCQKKELLAADDTPVPKGTSIRLVPKQTAERLAREQEAKRAAGTERPRRKRR